MQEVPREVYALMCCPGYDGTHVTQIYTSEGRAKVMADLGNVLGVRAEIQKCEEFLSGEPDDLGREHWVERIAELRELGKGEVGRWPYPCETYWVSPEILCA
jgi:hypothetical protein